MAEYLLDNAWRQQRQRLAGLEAWFDPGTIRHLEALGVGAGWRCLEVGGGGGSIAEWFCRRVGPAGHVLATDLDTRFLDALHLPNLEVRHHNILTDVLPESAFDLVHARFVVEHLRERLPALRQMQGALRPGGWLLIEDTDSSSWLAAPTADAEAAALFDRWAAAYIQLCRDAGADANAGRRLYGELHALGLAEIGAEGRVFMVRGGSPNAEVWRLTAEQVRERIVDCGLLTAREMERLLALMANPEFIWMEALVMAAWGRQPAPPA
jgi:SAM-dependent methyltransferase